MKRHYNLFGFNIDLKNIAVISEYINFDYLFSDPPNDSYYGMCYLMPTRICIFMVNIFGSKICLIKNVEDINPHFLTIDEYEIEGHEHCDTILTQKGKEYLESEFNKFLDHWKEYKNKWTSHNTEKH